jgi:hypothetical protein
MIYKKKGELDWIFASFIFIIFGLLLMAPIVLKIFISVREPISASLGNLSVGGSEAQAGFDKVMGTGISFWDQVIVAVFFFNILLLVISAIFIDTNPLFIVLFIVLAMLTIIFSPLIISSLDNLYGNPAYTSEVAQLPFMNMIRENFSVFLLGLMVFLGIIIYGKLALFSSGRANSRR